MSSKAPLTAFEDHALTTEFNLADGHAQHLMPDDLLASFPDVGTLLKGGVVDDYKTQETGVVESFLSLFGQTHTNADIYCYYSASQAIETASHIAKDLKRTTYLVEPTFDNLADLFSRTNAVPRRLLENSTAACSRSRYNRENLRAVRDEKTISSGLIERIPSHSALFLVLPNNPTGTEVTEHDFISLCEQCSKKDILLIVDFCFRPHSDGMMSWNVTLQTLQRVAVHLDVTPANLIEEHSEIE